MIGLGYIYQPYEWKIGDIITADKLNHMEDGIANAMDNYSTNETVIGTWIDGKPLYRKVIQGTIPTLPSVSQWVKAESFPKDFTVVKTSAYTIDKSGSFIQLNLYGLIEYLISTIENAVYFRGAKTYENQPYHVILEYTKTTD